MSKKGNCLLLILVAFSSAIIFQACSSTSEAKPGYYASGYMQKVNASVAAAPLSGDFETPPILKASEYLPEKIRKSKYHTVEEKIYTDGFSNRYRLNSVFFSLNVYGDEMLKERVREVVAMAQLLKMKKSKQFTNAVINTAKSPYYLAKELVNRPVDTVSGVPKGLWRMMGRVGEMVTGERGDAEDSAAKELLGFSAAKRKLAHQLKVDVYTTNITLQEKLNSVAWASFGGGFITGLAMAPIKALALTKSAYRMNKVLLDNAPEDLRKLNREKLQKIIFNEVLIDQFLDHPYFSPRHETFLVDSLYRMSGAKNRSHFIKVALTAQSFDEAFFFQRVAQLMLEYHQNISPVEKIHVVSRLLMASATNGKILLPLDLDYGVWSTKAATKINAVLKNFSEKAPGKQLEIWVTGTLSERAKQEMKAAGIGVTEKAFKQFQES